MAQILLVGLGGFIGSIVRFILSSNISSFHHSLIPYPTMFVNLLGSFLIGIILSMGEQKLGMAWFYFLVPGVLGGFTTYSAFSGETMMLIKNHSYSPALIYVAVTLIGGILLSALGYSSIQLILNRI